MDRSGARSSRMETRGRLKSPRRNRFFHGKMMDAYHFELETGYGLTMRRMINRMVLGGGVVCGLDVVPGSERCSIQVTPGLAIDAWGREVVVPELSRPVYLGKDLIRRVCGRDDDNCDDNGTPSSNGYGDDKNPPAQGADDGEQTPERLGNGKEDHDHDHEEACLTVTLCYEECESDPVDVLAGDCGSSNPCAPGSIRERYSIRFERGCRDPYEVSCRFPDVLRNGELDYRELARFVTRECPDPPRNSCIPVANLRVSCEEGNCDIDDENIDITIRPVVFGNALLFDMLSRIVEEEQSGDSWRR